MIKMTTLKLKKQSLCDWQITKENNSFAWITKSSGFYVLTFKDSGKEITYSFRYLKEAVNFAKVN